MKKVLGSVAGAAVSMALLAGTAVAQSSITNTGPGSTNTITNSNSQECKVNNDNNVNVGNNNQQNSQTGNSGNTSNTTSGGAQSGNAGNNNQTNVGVDINNSGCKNGAQQPTPPPSPQPAAPGQVLGSVSPQPGRGAGAEALPETGTRPLAIFGLGALGLGIVSTAAYLGFTAMRLRALS